MGHMAKPQRAFTELTFGYRAHFVRIEPRPSPTRLAVQGWPASVLVFDTETTTDPTQRLNFGSFAYGRWVSGKIHVARRGLFHANDLSTRYRNGYDALTAYHADKDRSRPADSVEFELLSRDSFVNDVLWKAYQAGALICGFNLPFDLSRIAIDCGDGRGFFYGGFSIPLWHYDAEGGQRRWNPYRPRLNVKPIDSKRAFLRLSGTKQPQVGMHPDDVHGHLLDLKTLAFALTDKGQSLASACKAFDAEHQKHRVTAHGIITADYIRYNLRDVAASIALLEALRSEFDRHPIKLDAKRTLSPATMVKGYLRALNVTPPAIKFGDIPPELLGYAMTAYFGGRAECRIRHRIVPVVLLDVLSMYPTVNTLMGNWELLTAERLDVVDATVELRALLEGTTPERVFEPEFWRELQVFAEIEADGDVLPVRARYGDGDEFSIGVNEVHGATSWFAAPDVVASMLLAGRIPKVIRAFRLVPRSRQHDLRAVNLAGHTLIDPTAQNFFKTVIEARLRAKNDQTMTQSERERLVRFFKVLANAGAYGIFAEINPENLPAGERTDMRLYGLHAPCDVKTHWPEDGGEFCFPPLAALITSAARLMLALLERCVTDLGGTYAFCDTDSMAIVATPDGGPIANPARSRRRGPRQPAISALSFAQVDEIVQRFERLNPYDRSIIPGSILKIEDENYAPKTEERRQLYGLVISAKRYALFNLDEAGAVEMRKPSQHGLGHLMDPLHSEDDEVEVEDQRGKAPEWVQIVWKYLIDKARGKRVRRPAWFDYPAVSRISITTPDLLEQFGGKRRDLWYDDRVKAFNFLLSAHVFPGGHGEDQVTGQLFDPSTFHPVAPFTRDPQAWLEAEWIDRGTGRSVRISTTANLSDPDIARVHSYGDIVDRYWVHREPKSAAPDGTACEPTTSGVLGRRSFHKADALYISKEARRLEDVQRGDVHRWPDVLDVFVDEETEWVRELLPALRRLKRSDAVTLLGITERAVTELRQGRSRPSRETRRTLSELARNGQKGRKGKNGDSASNKKALLRGYLTKQSALHNAE